MSAPRIAIVTSMRDEGPNLLHWIAHHRAAGVTDFLVFTNDCADGTEALLDRLAAAGILTHIRNAVPQGRTPQWAALRQARGHPALAGAEWIAALDCDEYVNLRAPLGSLGDLVRAVGAADAIVLPWRLFGHAGRATRAEAPPTEAFDRAIPADALYPALCRFFKTLYRAAGPFTGPGVHRPRQVKGASPAWVDGSGRGLPDEFARSGRIMLWGGPLATDLVQLNHYSVRSAEEFVAKSARGLPNHTDKPVDLTYWVERNFNTVADASIARMAPATAAEHARLKALPGVAEAEAAARDWHARAFAAAMTDPAAVKLFGRLILAGGSTAPPEAVARQLVALYGRAAQGGGGALSG
ncbi:glycosyltransferase family 2 protein [Palleronia sediminis]|nr:glycosyltransferase family 2 protein [Palleronia sediminis]